MTREPFDPADHVDGTDFLAKTVIEPEHIGPIGFIWRKERVRVKAESKPSEPFRLTRDD